MDDWTTPSSVTGSRKWKRERGVLAKYERLKKHGKS